MSGTGPASQLTPRADPRFATQEPPHRLGSSPGAHLLTAGVYGGAILGVLVILIGALVEAVGRTATGALGGLGLLPVLCVAAAIVGALAGAIPGAVAWVTAAATRGWTSARRAVLVGVVSAIPSAGVAYAVSIGMGAMYVIPGTLVGTVVGAVGLAITTWSVLRGGESAEAGREGSA